MTASMVIGVILIAALFVGLTAVIARMEGWADALTIIGGAIAITAVIVLAAFLLSGAITF